MRKENDTLNEIIAPVVTGLGYEFWGCVYVPQKGSALLRVYIEKEQGIGLEDCQQVSRQISGVLDVEDPIIGRYTLEVSSPGMDRPLFTRQHFERFLGYQIKVRLQVPVQDRRNYQGVLRAIEGDNIILVSDEGEFTLALSSIDKANLVPEF